MVTIEDSGPVQEVKVVVIGDSAAGKTAMLRKFFDRTFDENTSATIGIDFRYISYQLRDGTKVRLQIWDTAGQERFRQLAPAYIRSAQVILIVFDLTSSNVLEQISRWTLFAEREREEGAVVVLVGNKCDLKQRRNDRHVMDRMMAQYNATYVETSAKPGHNIDELFSLVAHMPFPKHQKSQSAPIRISSVAAEPSRRYMTCCS